MPADEKIIRAYEALVAEGGEAFDASTAHARIAEQLGVREDRVEAIMSEYWFMGWGG